MNLFYYYNAHCDNTSIQANNCMFIKYVYGLLSISIKQVFYNMQYTYYTLYKVLAQSEQLNKNTYYNIIHIFYVAHMFPFYYNSQDIDFIFWFELQSNTQTDAQKWRQNCFKCA